MALRSIPPLNFPLAGLGAFLICTLLVAAGCSTPNYVDKKGGSSSIPVGFMDVIYHVYDEHEANPPECIAVLPFEAEVNVGKTTSKITLKHNEAVRRSIYAHLAPHGARDVELKRVDFVLNQTNPEKFDDWALIGEQLSCNALLKGVVTEYGSNYLGVYSRVAVGAKLELIRATDGVLLWEGEHTAESHGGTIPLSPVGLGMGILDAAMNMQEERLFRVIDDLSRRLVSTIPDNMVMVFDAPIETTTHSVKSRVQADDGLPLFLKSVEQKSAEQQIDAIVEAILTDRFDNSDMRELYEWAGIRHPTSARLHERYTEYAFQAGDYETAMQAINESLAIDDGSSNLNYLKGRILIKLGKVEEADKSLVTAVARDSTKAKYFNALGYVNSLANNYERARAAYEMAIERDPRDGYAYYNLAVIMFNKGELKEAGDAFYGAGLAYIDMKDYGQALKALDELRGILRDGYSFENEILTLENAINAILKKDAANA